MGARHLKHTLLLTPALSVLTCLCSVWLCETLWTVAHQAPLSMGFSRPESWPESPCPPPGDLPDLGITSASLCLLHWQVVSIPLVPRGKPSPQILKQANLNAASKTSTTPYLLYFQNISRIQPSSYSPLPLQFSIISLLAYGSSLQCYLLGSTFTKTPFYLAKLHQFGSQDVSLKLVRSYPSSAQIFLLASHFTQNKKWNSHNGPLSPTLSISLDSPHAPWPHFLLFSYSLIELQPYRLFDCSIISQKCSPNGICACSVWNVPCKVQTSFPSLVSWIFVCLSPSLRNIFWVLHLK